MSDEKEFMSMDPMERMCFVINGGRFEFGTETVA
jgi:hypothetical protein